MNNEIERIGQKVIANSDRLAEKLFQAYPHESVNLSIDFQSQFFRCLGEALVLDEKLGKEKVTQWLSLHQQKAAHTPFSSYLYQSIILDFLENEAINSKLPSNILIKVMKKFITFIQDASSFLSTSLQQKMLEKTSKFPLPLEDERITLQELSDLKNALKEATILTITDSKDIIKYTNHKFCQLTKYSSEELIGQNHHSLLNSGYHHEEFFQDIRSAIKEGRVWKGEIRNKAKDGSYYWVDKTIVPFLDDEGKTYQHISIENDITEQKNTEEMIQKTEKLSLVGELAAGIAHEIRNPLTTIRGFVQILEHFSEEKKLLYSKTILEEIDRINFIVSEFMVFAKPQAVNFSKMNITEIIKNVVNFLGAETAMKNVEITYSFDREVYIYGEKNQLTQVFLNMFKNAIDALPYGGNITILITSSEQRVIVSVQDNGIGMTEEQIKRIGEPFYTTKDNGNGLGLMVSYKIIENHRGQIEVKSEPNKGTTFMVTFPVISEKNE